MSNTPPRHASVVVTGGGVTVCSTRFFNTLLSGQDGASDTILLERNQLTSGTTWHSSALRSLLFTDETAVPLGHEPVYYNDRIIGKTTSCAFGYRLGQSPGLAFIDSEYCSGERFAVKVDIGGGLIDADVVRGPLYYASAL